MFGLVGVDFLAIKCSVLKDHDHLSGNLVPPFGEVRDLILKRCVGRVVALEGKCGYPRKRLEAQLTDGSVNLLVCDRQAREQVLIVALRVR